MRGFCGKTGVLYPIYRLVGRGRNNAEIAAELHTSELNVTNCIAWILSFLNLTDRSHLTQHAAWATVPVPASPDGGRVRTRKGA